MPRVFFKIPVTHNWIQHTRVAPHVLIIIMIITWHILAWKELHKYIFRYAFSNPAWRWSPKVGRPPYCNLPAEFAIWRFPRRALESKYISLGYCVMLPLVICISGYVYDMHSTSSNSYLVLDLCGQVYWKINAFWIFSNIFPNGNERQRSLPFAPFPFPDT